MLSHDIGAHFGIAVVGDGAICRLTHSLLPNIIVILGEMLMFIDFYANFM